MYTFSIIFILIASLLLILIVLVQNPKGGGLSAGFTGVNQFGGVAQTNKFLENSTWTLAVVILAFSIVASLSINHKVVEQSDLTEVIENTDFNASPTIPLDNPTTTEE